MKSDAKQTKWKKNQVNPIKIKNPNLSPPRKLKNQTQFTQKRKAKWVTESDLKFRYGSSDLVPLWGVHVQRRNSFTFLNCYNYSLSLTHSLSLCTFYNFPSLFHDFLCLSLSLSLCVQTKQMGYSIEDERMRFKKKREGGSGSRFSRGDNLTLPPHPTLSLTHTPKALLSIIIGRDYVYKLLLVLDNISMSMSLCFLFFLFFFLVVSTNI